MENYDIRNYIKHKAFAQAIVSEVSLILQKVNEKCSKMAEHYESLNLQMQTAKTIYQAQQISKSIDEAQSQLIFTLSLSDRLETLLKRNQKRIKFLDFKIQTEKANNFNFSKKEMLATLQNEKIKLEDKLVGLNNTQNTVLTFYCDQIFKVVDSEISLKNKENYKILNNLEEKEFKLVTDKFPKSLLSINGEQFLDVKFKQKILKQIISICDAKLKSCSAYEMNEYFGNPLVLSTKIPSNINEFVDEIKNLFNVKTKLYSLNQYPYLEKYIESKLICDEKSKTLPREYQKVEEEIIQDETEEEEEDIFDMSDFSKSLEEMEAELNRLQEEEDRLKAEQQQLAEQSKNISQAAQAQQTQGNTNSSASGKTGAELDSIEDQNITVDQLMKELFGEDVQTKQTTSNNNADEVDDTDDFNKFLMDLLDDGSGK